MMPHTDPNQWRHLIRHLILIQFHTLTPTDHVSPISWQCNAVYSYISTCTHTHTHIHCLQTFTFQYSTTRSENMFTGSHRSPLWFQANSIWRRPEHISVVSRATAAAHTKSILRMFWARWLQHGMCDCDCNLCSDRTAFHAVQAVVTWWVLRRCLKNFQGMKTAKMQRPVLRFSVYLIVNASHLDVPQPKKCKWTLNLQDFID